MTTTPLSERLQQAKDELGLSVRRAVAEAEKGGYEISVYTVTQCLNGKHGQVTPTTVEALSHAFRIPYDELSRLAGLADRHRAFRLEGRTAEYADALTRQQADAVTEIMRLLAEGNKGQLEQREAVGHDVRDTPMNRAAGSAATDEVQERRGVTRKYTPPWELDEAASYGEEGIDPDEDMPF